jgi:hypothetical protein
MNNEEIISGANLAADHDNRNRSNKSVNLVNTHPEPQVMLKLSCSGKRQ